MAALLVYSQSCKHCQEIMHLLQSNPSLQSLVQFHNVNTQGIPPQYRTKINRVPTLLTKNGKLLVGSEVKRWLESLVPCEITNCTLGSMSCSMASVDGDEDDGNMFNLDDYGRSLQPVMTPELQDKIKKDVGAAFNTFNKA